MQTIINQQIAGTYSNISNTPSLWTKFMSYCNSQEKNRLMWVGIVLASHGCVLTPLTVMATFFAGPSLILFMSGMVAMGIALVTNLAAMPTKITIPAFALSVLIDIAIVIASVVLATS